MFDEARAILGMMKMCHASQSEMAKKLGVSQSYVANKLRLLKLDESLQRGITENALTERHARAILRLTDDGQRHTALEKICAKGLNVAETEALVDFLRDETAPKMIGRATAQSRIDVFLSTLKSSLTTLRSLGIDASQTTNFHGTKTYITICIDEAR